MITYGFSIPKGIYLEGNNLNIFVLQTKNGYKEIRSEGKPSLALRLRKLIYTMVYNFPSIFCIGTFYGLYEQGIIWLLTGSFTMNLPTFYTYFSIFVFLLFFLKKYSSFPKYHAAEHMVVEHIERYGAEKELTIKNLREINRISFSCSTRLLFPLITAHLFFMIITTFTSVNESVIIIGIILSMTFIAMKDLAPMWYYTLSLKFSALIQEKLTTKRPDDEQLALAIYAAKKVIEAKGKSRKTIST